MPVGEVTGAVVILCVTVNLLLAMIALYVLVGVARKDRPSAGYQFGDHAGPKDDIKASLLEKLGMLAEAVQKAATEVKQEGTYQQSWRSIMLKQHNLTQGISKLNECLEMNLQGQRGEAEYDKDYRELELAFKATQWKFMHAHIMRARSPFRLVSSCNIRKILKLAKANKTAMKALSKQCNAYLSNVQAAPTDDQTSEVEAQLVELAREYYLASRYLQDATDRRFDTPPELGYCPAFFEAKMSQLWTEFQCKCYEIKKHPRVFFGTIAKKCHWDIEAPELTLHPREE
jgi:hypothetical protein